MRQFKTYVRRVSETYKGKWFDVEGGWAEDSIEFLTGNTANEVLAEELNFLLGKCGGFCKINDLEFVYEDKDFDIMKVYDVNGKIFIKECSFIEFDGDLPKMYINEMCAKPINGAYIFEEFSWGDNCKNEISPMVVDHVDEFHKGDAKKLGKRWLKKMASTNCMDVKDMFYLHDGDAFRILDGNDKTVDVWVFDASEEKTYEYVDDEKYDDEYDKYYNSARFVEIDGRIVDRENKESK